MTGLIQIPYLAVMGAIPCIFLSYLTSFSFGNVILYIIILALNILILIPFFRSYDKKILAQENGESDTAKAENGLGAKDEVTDDNQVHDAYRISYLREHIKAMKDAVEIDGVDLLGYTAWGPIDLISAGTGEMSKRYGFVYVDFDDLGKGTGKRIKKDSYDWYKHVIETNGEEL